MPRPRLAPGSWGDFIIRPTGDGTYAGRVYYRTLDGVRREVTASGPTKISVDRALKERLPVLIATTTGPPAPPELTFAEVVTKWLEYEELKLLDHQKAAGTHAEHVRMLTRHLLPTFGDDQVSSITPARVFDYYTNMARAHAPLARNVKSLLTQILRHAINLGALTGTNPAASVTSIRRAKRPIFAPDIEDLRMLRDATLAYMNDEDRPGPAPSMLVLDTIDLILATGERISEVLGLRFVHDIHLDADAPYCVVNGAIKEKGGPKRWEPFPKTEAGRRDYFCPTMQSRSSCVAWSTIRRGASFCFTLGAAARTVHRTSTAHCGQFASMPASPGTSHRTPCERPSLLEWPETWAWTPPRR